MERLEQRYFDRLWTGIDRSGGIDACWPWTGSCTTAGYGHLTMRSTQRYTHRLVMELLIGRRLGRLEYVLHSCDNPPCCNPGHIRVGTQLQNVDDRRRRGRARNGHTNPERDKVIWAEWQRGDHPDDIAARHGLCDGPSVYRIIRRLRQQGWGADRGDAGSNAPSQATAPS